MMNRHAALVLAGMTLLAAVVLAVDLGWLGRRLARLE